MARKIPDVIAAVDLGSNSFHMVVARYSHGQLIILDRLREMVRLGAGLGEQGRLTRGALGHPIEIISGIEEARLIYLGVAHTMPSDPGRRLVVDIGGGSTEVIIGEGKHAKKLESLYMGCVSMSSRYFNDGGITDKRIKRARLGARLELEPVRANFRNYGWDQAVGSSGTIRSVGDVIRARNNGDGAITPAAVDSLLDHAVKAGEVSKLRLPGLSEERLPVFVGGLAILVEIFDSFDIKSMRVADGALREGLLYDLVGRFTDEDARVRSVRAMQGRYHVDAAQSERVEASALDFLRQTTREWQLDEPFAEPVLSWAARLHEIGLDVSHSHYHKHGAYLLANADMPGFPQEEQRILSAVVGAHRRKVSVDSLQELTPPWHIKAEYLIVLLRLAVLLHRGRSATALPKLELQAKGRSLEIVFPKGWLDAPPLTATDLENEIEYLKAGTFRLRVS